MPIRMTKPAHFPVFFHSAHAQRKKDKGDINFRMNETNCKKNQIQEPLKGMISFKVR